MPATAVTFGYVQMRVASPPRNLRRLVARAAFALCLLIAGHLGDLAAAADRRGFQVADSIGMTQVTEPAATGTSTSMAGDSVPVSPDQAHFFVVLKRGNLRTGENDYQLVLYNVREVLQKVDAGIEFQPKVVATASSASNHPGISMARWIDSKRIGYLVETANGTTQIQVVDIETAGVTTLTRYRGNVVGFDIPAHSEKFIFAGEELPDWTDRRKHGYAVENDSIFDVMHAGVGKPLIANIGYYVGDMAIGAERRVSMPSYESLGGIVWGQWVSPRGRWAVLVRQVATPPRSWLTQYLPIANDSLVSSKMADVDQRTFSKPQLQVPLQYVLADLTDGTVKSLVDAPTGFLYGGYILRACWASDESNVVLANTFLPLQGEAPPELQRRRAVPAIVSIDMRKGRLHRIADLNVRIAGSHLSDGLVDAYMGSGDRLVVKVAQGSAADKTFVYRRVGQDWLKTNEDSRRLTTRFEVRIEQTLDTPPELSVTDKLSGKTAVVSDFNPQFRDIELGKTEVMRWTGARGTQWIGGLLIPPHAAPNHRYPLVIQTHGFNPKLFLLDGAASSGYAARALAGRGIAVLQVNDPVGILGIPQEPKDQVDGYISAIQKLVGDGLIDEQRVGIHGWSRTGLYVQRALLFSDLTFAAANVSDASEIGEWPYAYMFGTQYPAMQELEDLGGAPLWDCGTCDRAANDPTSHLQQLHTPLRIEAYDMGMSWWSTYAILRRHQRPAEYVSIPDGAHALVKPFERLTSQGGSLDWFDFWLNGHEDADVAKAAQYHRWEKLCDRQKAESADRPVFCVGTTH